MKTWNIVLGFGPVVEGQMFPKQMLNLLTSKVKHIGTGEK